MLYELVDVCDRIDAGPDLRVAVVTGRALCGGADSEAGDDHRSARASDTLAAPVVRSIQEPDQLPRASYELADGLASNLAPVAE